MAATSLLTAQYCSCAPPEPGTGSPGWQQHSVIATAGPESAWQLQLTLSSSHDLLPVGLRSRQLDGSQTFAGPSAGGP